jgi:diguanylate cyclase (GGDEF)-like protein
MHRPHVWIIVLLCADLAALSDLITGPELWLGPVYLLVICLAAWALGWRAGLVTGLGCMALTFGINGTSLYPYGGAEIVANFVMRFAAVMLVITIIEGVRRAYITEWYQARMDSLTGALNRQAFFELGASDAGSHDWRLLAYADLDGLKLVNDRHGHSAGDACLKLYASAVRKMIRRDDIFARVGGDEFLILMIVKDELSARSVASRLHTQMNSISSDECANIRCSVGALIVPPGRRSIDELVRLADGLMYQAKSRDACLQVALAGHGDAAVHKGRARRVARRAEILWGAQRKRELDRRDPLVSTPLLLPRAPS